MLKKVLIVLSLIAIIVVVGCFAIFYLPELLINNIIHIPPDTNLVYETGARYGASAATHSVYYLSSTDITGLVNWYKDFYPAFRSGNPQQQ